jgi:hypothetical protein
MPYGGSAPTLESGRTPATQRSEKSAGRPPHGGHPNRGSGLKTASELIWMIEDMKHETHNDAQVALHALLAGAEGCGPGARSARLAQDDELADFLCKTQDDIAPEAKRLLAQRVAE